MKDRPPRLKAKDEAMISKLDKLGNATRLDASTIFRLADTLKGRDIPMRKL